MKREPSRPTVPCPNCYGGGRVTIADQYWNTLKALREAGKATAEQLHQLMGQSVGRTAVNNWLEFLRRAGLARRKKVNREWVYRATLP